MNEADRNLHQYGSLTLSLLSQMECSTMRIMSNRCAGRCTTKCRCACSTLARSTRYLRSDTPFKMSFSSGILAGGTVTDILLQSSTSLNGGGYTRPR